MTDDNEYAIAALGVACDVLSRASRDSYDDNTDLKSLAAHVFEAMEIIETRIQPLVPDDDPPIDIVWVVMTALAFTWYLGDEPEHPYSGGGGMCRIAFLIGMAAGQLKVLRDTWSIACGDGDLLDLWEWPYAEIDTLKILS